MSRSYEMIIQYPVSLIDIPDKLRITDSPEFELKVTISGKGLYGRRKTKQVGRYI